MTFKCGPCGESDGTKKAKCPETKKESGFSKKPCNANNKTKPKCHPSVEKFKSGNGSKSAGDDQKRQCTSTSQDCHESQKKFLQKETCHENKTEADCGSRFAKSEAEDCTKSEEKVINPCSQQTEEPPCSNASRKLSSIKQKLTCGSSPQSKNKPPCSNAYQKLSPNTQQEGECGSSSSLYSKITSTCKDLAKDFVKFKQSKPACPKDSLKYPLQNLPPTTLPCPPKAEKGSDKNGSLRCSGAKVSSGPCPDKKPPSWTDFFPLDARNDELNACIEKYSKIDPNKVISKCSQFANVTVDDTEKCIKVDYII